MYSVKGKLVDLFQKKIISAELLVKNGKVWDIAPAQDVPDHYILPGFIDAHIHIESSMLPPSSFAREAVKHGTVGTVSDPHEIANVCGIAGVDYMIRDAMQVPLKIHFGAPSCVPATSYETSGAVITSEDIGVLMRSNDIHFLSEVMNFPAVLQDDEEILKKIRAAQAAGKPVDGHAPGMRYPDTERYFSKGISTDHECISMEEAIDKIHAGCKILIREGSAAKNFDALVPLFKDYASHLMFCSDDKHPDDLVLGHINRLVARAVEEGYDLYDVLKAACVHPVQHYSMNVGLLRTGEAADFIVVKNLNSFEVMETWINGACVFKNGEVRFEVKPAERINTFHCRPKNTGDFVINAGFREGQRQVHIIEALDGQLITNKFTLPLPVINNTLQIDKDNDILKIAVVNRYKDAPPCTGFVKHFGLRDAAIASTVAHDSHNIVVVGSSDALICKAVNLLIETEGGICFVDENGEDVLPLPIAGLMSDKDAVTVAEHYQRLTMKARQAGSMLQAPFMTLSFMALPVIPRLKMTDLGLFDTAVFGHIPLFSEDGLNVASSTR